MFFSSSSSSTQHSSTGSCTLSLWKSTPWQPERMDLPVGIRSMVDKWNGLILMVFLFSSSLPYPAPPQ